LVISTLADLSPTAFFDVLVELKKKPSKRAARRTFLPDLSALLSEESFADLAVYWTTHGLSLNLVVRTPLTATYFPHFRRGDSLELFLDTRKQAKSHVITRFCHHFVFTPEEVDGVQARELTRFRADDTHDRADPSLFTGKTTPTRSGYQMEIEIPKTAIYGYEPEAAHLLGLSYRVNRAHKPPQHFSLSSRTFSLEKHPELWPTAKLI